MRPNQKQAQSFALPFQNDYFYAMLSILIPIFNFDVRPLVKRLGEQCEAAQIAFEIRCLDDCSSPVFKELNAHMKSQRKVIYTELKENVGRAKIRNLLAQAAQFDFLLFMDCDSQVNHEDYIQRYLNRLDPKVLLYGGRSYTQNAPSDPDFYLHWHYGSKREQQNAEQRNLAPYHAFMTNNFLIPKKIFESIQFEEQLKQYGHEDTLFGLALAKKQIPIVHLDNPLEHIGLEKASIFLQKSQQAIENLWYLSSKQPDLDTRLLKVYRKIKSWKLSSLVLWMERMGSERIERHLLSSKPNLKVFDFYKLTTLLKQEEKKGI